MADYVLADFVAVASGATRFVHVESFHGFDHAAIDAALRRRAKRIFASGDFRGATAADGSPALFHGSAVPAQRKIETGRWDDLLRRAYRQAGRLRARRGLILRREATPFPVCYGLHESLQF
jgi:hypothetical protein